MKVKIPVHKTSWSQGENPIKKVTIDVKNWPLADRKKICRAVADAEWPEINSSFTFVNMPQILAMNFSCAGHGGIIVWSSVKFDGWEEVIGSESFGNFKFPANFYVYAFEEDQAWAVVWRNLDDIAKKKFLKKAGSAWDIHKTNDEAHKIITVDFAGISYLTRNLWK